MCAKQSIHIIRSQLHQGFVKRKWLRAKAGHNEAKALYHAGQRRNIEIARSMMADGEPASKIMRYTGLILAGYQYLHYAINRRGFCGGSRKIEKFI